MKPNFLEAPELWTRASRTYSTPAEYAAAVERFRRKGHSVAPWVGGVILAVISTLLLLGKL